MIGLVLAAMLTLPPAWKHVTIDNPPGSTVEMLDIALGPTVDGFETKINVLRHRLSDSSTDITEWAHASEQYLQQKSVRVVASHAERLCHGTRDGWSIESVGTYADRSLDLVQTALLDNGFEYVATYSRPENAPADKDALQALDQVCPTG